MKTENISHQPPKSSKERKAKINLVDEKSLPDMSIREWFFMKKMAMKNFQFN